MEEPRVHDVPRIYGALKWLAWVVMRVFYRPIEMSGTETFPADRPAVLVANHTNALADPIVLLARLPGLPRFLAASSWWRWPPVRWFFRLGGVVPIHRAQDGGAAANRSTFAACHEALAGGSHLAMFPEGGLNDGPALLPVKTGAARIALGAAADSGVRGVAVVPVGMVYEDRGRFRSQVAIQLGIPIEIDAWVDRYRADPRAAVQDLTREIDERLRRVTLNHETWEESKLVERAATAVLADRRAGPLRYLRHTELRRTLGAALARAGEGADDGPVLAQALARYDADLRALELPEASAGSLFAGSSASVRRRLEGQLVVLGPAAAFGVVANAPVALVLFGVSRAVRQPAWQATAKGLAGFVLCPVLWSAEAYAVRRHGRRAVVATLVAAPVGALAWVAWYGRWKQWRRLVRNDELAATRPDEVRALRTSRGRVIERVDHLVATADSPTPVAPAAPTVEVPAELAR